MILSEQTILITGGNSGIGRFLVEKLSDQCVHIIVIDKKENNKFEGFNNISYYICDLTDYVSVTETFLKVFEIFPKISILINNAGLIYSEPLVNILSKKERRHSYEMWDATIKANLYTVFNVSSTLIDNMLKNKVKGLIINISSIAARGNPGQTSYSAAKAGVNALTYTWSKELAPFGIRVAGISPGFFDTESTRTALSQARIEKITQSIPLKRLGKLDEILLSLKFIIENDYLTGRLIELDGGLSL
ncbi:MAG: SDR family NAD(P)-dependent oxidoreductase [Candidatus Eremiobacterota bacterium]